MSYRTRVNGIQIFGNNEYYDEWINYIKSIGISVDEDDGCYEGEISDFMEALAVIESITLRLETERRDRWASIEAKHKDKSYNSVKKLKEEGFGYKSLFDFSSTYDQIQKNPKEESLLDKEFEILDYSYMFLPYTFYKACENSIESAGLNFMSNHIHQFKIKNGCKIKISAG